MTWKVDWSSRLNFIDSSSRPWAFYLIPSRNDFVRDSSSMSSSLRVAGYFILFINVKFFNLSLSYRRWPKYPQKVSSQQIHWLILNTWMIDGCFKYSLRSINSSSKQALMSRWTNYSVYECSLPINPEKSMGFRGIFESLRDFKFLKPCFMAPIG